MLSFLFSVQDILQCRMMPYLPPVCTNTHFFCCENPLSKACCEDPPFSTELPRRQLCPVTEGEEESGRADSHTTWKPRQKRRSHDPSRTMMLMHCEGKLIYARTERATRGCAAEYSLQGMGYWYHEDYTGYSLESSSLLWRERDRKQRFEIWAHKEHWHWWKWLREYIDVEGRGERNLTCNNVTHGFDKGRKSRNIRLTVLPHWLPNNKSSSQSKGEVRLLPSAKRSIILEVCAC